MHVVRNRLAVALVGLACALPGPSADAATISIVADEWCPYNCTPGSSDPGFMIEIAQKVLGAAGHTIDYKILPWSRAVDETRKGKFTAVVGAANDDAPDFAFPGSALGLSTTVFAVRKGDPWRYTGPASLAGISVGVIQDYSYEDGFDAYVEANAKDSAKIQVATGEDALGINIKKLEAKRIGALVEDQAVLEYELKQAGKAGTFDVAGDLGESELFIAFSPAVAESKEYARLLGEGVEKMRASGELATLLAKYGAHDWKK